MRDQANDECVAPFALVVGSGASPADVEAASRGAGPLLFYTLHVAAAWSGATDHEHKIIDVVDQSLATQQIAWDWARGLVTETVDSGLHLPSDAVLALRRALCLRLLWPIAVAEARAKAVRSLVPAGMHLKAIGVTSTEANALGVSILPSVPRSSTAVPFRELNLYRKLRRVGGNAARLNRRVWSPVGRKLEVFAEVRERRELRREALAAVAELSRRGGFDKRALVLAAFGVHLELQAGVVAQLKSRDWDVVILSLSGGLEAEAKRLGVPVVDYRPFLSHGSTAAWGGAIGDIPARLLRAVEHWTKSQDLGRHAETILRGLEEELLAARRSLRAHDEVLGALVPDLVLTVNEINPLVELGAVAARRRCVPTVNVQHGSAGDTPLNSEFAFDIFCVWGEADAELFASLGTDRKRIRVTGDPYSDYRAHLLGGVEPRALRQIPSETDEQRNNTILFPVGYSKGCVTDWNLYSTLKIVLQYAEENPAWSITLKCHPAMCALDPGYATALAEHPAVQVAVIGNRPIYDLLESCDCVATFGSTVAIEAVALRKPVVVVRPAHPLDDPFGLVTAGAALIAHDASSFGECMRRITHGKGPHEADLAAYDARHFFRRDGRVAERIADICADLTST